MWILYLIRVVRKYRRRLLERLAPDWVDDSLSLLSHLNLLLLVPTIYMMAFQPNHFFKSIPAIRRKAKTYYATPIKFATNAVFGLTLLLTYVVPESPTFSTTRILVANGLLAAFSPIFIVATCALTLALWAIAQVRAKWLLDAFPVNHHGLIIPLELETYRALDGSKYVRSLCYYYLYFYLVIAIIVLVAATFISATLAMVSHGLGVDRIPPQLLIIVCSVIAGLVVLLANILLIRPYVCLLTSSTPKPTKRMELFASDVSDEDRILEALAEDRRRASAPTGPLRSSGG
jgi:hypothetical protein